MTTIAFKTNLGEIHIQLDMTGTPKTSQQIKELVQNGYYNNIIFHRVINDFMIQGGGFTSGMQSKPKQPNLMNEAATGKKNRRGTIAMARTSDPHSASTQFFINVKDNSFLDFRSETIDGFGYCVFGEVISGMDVVDQIKKVKTGRSQGHDDVPKEDIIIESAWVVSEKNSAAAAS